MALSACAPHAAEGPVAVAAALSRQPPNVGDAKRVAAAYRTSGAYARDLQEVATNAAEWLAHRVPLRPRPALVLDVDETALSNWEVIEADDFGRVIGGPCAALPEGPCGWASWDLLARARPIASTLSLFQRARELGVAVFFISGRPESQRAATEQNLRAAGYDGYYRLVLVPDGVRFTSAVAFKAPARAEIEREGYAIIANVGDQPSDLADGHAERAFLLPNPFYRIP